MKLIRDNEDSETINQDPRSDEEKLVMITDAIRDTSLEFMASKQRNPDKLADLLELIVIWASVNGFSEDLVMGLMKIRRANLGAFEQFIGEEKEI